MNTDKVTITITVNLAGADKHEGNAKYDLTIHEKYLDYLLIKELLVQTENLISDATNEYKKLNS